MPIGFAPRIRSGAWGLAAEIDRTNEEALRAVRKDQRSGPRADRMSPDELLCWGLGLRWWLLGLWMRFPRPRHCDDCDVESCRKPFRVAIRARASLSFLNLLGFSKSGSHST